MVITVYDKDVLLITYDSSITDKSSGNGIVETLRRTFEDLEDPAPSHNQNRTKSKDKRLRKRTDDSIVTDEEQDESLARRFILTVYFNKKITLDNPAWTTIGFVNLEWQYQY